MSSPDFLPPGFQPPETEEPSVGERVFGGLVTGLRSDPILRPFVTGLSEGFGFTESDLQDIERRIGRSGLASTAEFIGQAVPFVVGGGIAGSLGRKATVAVARRHLPRLQAQFASRQAGTAVNKSLGERAVEIAGESLGFGAFEGAREAAEGGTPSEIARATLLGTTFAGAVGGGFTLTGKALFPGSRFRDLSKISKPEYDDLVRERLKQLREREARLWQQATESHPIDSIVEDVARTRGARARRPPLVAGQLSFPPDLKRGDRLFRRADAEIRKDLEKLPSAGGDIFSVPLFTRVSAEASSRAPRTQIAGRTQLGAQEALQIRRDLVRTQAAIQTLEKFKVPDSTVTRILLERPYNPAGDLRIARERLASRTNQVGRAFAAPAVVYHGFRMLMEPLVSKVLVSPENLGRRLGIFGSRAIELALEAEQAVLKQRAVTAHLLSDVVRGARAGLREVGLPVSNKAMKRHFREALDLYQSSSSKANGLRTVRDRFGVRFGNQWKRMVDELEGAQNRRVAPITGDRLPDPAELQALGRVWFPHMLDDAATSNPEALIRALVKRSGGRLTEVEATELLDLTPFGGQGLRRFASLEFERRVPGTLRQGVTDGIPYIDDPIEAARRFLDSSAARAELGARFGPNGELGEVLKGLIARELGVSQSETANVLIDHILFNRSAREAQRALGLRLLFPETTARRIADNLSSMQIVTKMTYGTVPNLFQSANNVLFFGLKAGLRGLTTAINKESREEVIKALGFAESVFSAMRTGMIGGQPNTFMERLAQNALRFTGFTGSEQLNRIMAGGAAAAWAREGLAKSLRRGGLTGEAAVRYRRGLSELGVDAQRVINRGRFLREEMDTIIRNGVRKTQFQAGQLDVPIFWRSPWGRVLFQFKTFAFNQTKLMRDAVFQEAANGNYKPLAYFVGFYPVIGELVADTVTGLKGKDLDERDDGVIRIVQNLAQMGGLGIAYNAVLSGRFGDSAGFFLGPTASDLFSLGNALAQPDNFGVGLSLLTRQPAFQAARSAFGLGAIGVGASMEAISRVDDLLESPSPITGAAPAESLEDLFSRAVRNKR